MSRQSLPGIVLACLAWAAVGCSGRPEPGAIEGRVTWQGEGIAAALVGAYPKPEQDAATPPLAEAASGSDGSFRLTLPEGRYWIWARATTSTNGRETRLVGQARPSPSNVEAGRQARADVELRDPSGLASAAGPAGAGVKGRVSGADGGKAFVYAYPGRLERPLGPGFAAVKAVAPDGAFRIDLGPGRYTLAVRQRRSGENFGALDDGDRVAVAAVEVTPGRYTDPGTLHLRPVDPERLKGTRRGSPESRTRAAGRIVDAEGKPVAALRVLAFRDARMAGKPLAVSGPTGPDGAFVLFLPGAGTYFLGARSRLGGPSEPGERVGAFRGDDGGGLRLKDGQERSGLVIPVEEVW